MFISTSILLDSIKDQVVSPAFVQLPNFFIDLLNGILEILDLGAGVVGGWPKVIQTKQASFDIIDVFFDVLDDIVLTCLMLNKVLISFLYG